MVSNLRLYQLLDYFVDTRKRARGIMVCWLAGNLLLAARWARRLPSVDAKTPRRLMVRLVTHYQNDVVVKSFDQVFTISGRLRRTR